jgi:GNAT superfamily N-acetyltransferase
MHLGFATYRAFAPAGWSPPAPFERQVAAIAERMRAPGVWALLAERAGEPMAHVAMAPGDGPGPTAYLWQLFVRPAFWGTGVAGLLHESFLARAAQAGYRRARLATPAPHTRARRFYERRGWRTDGPPDDLWHFGIPLVAYVRPLLPPPAGEGTIRPSCGPRIATGSRPSPSSGRDAPRAT